MNKIEELIEKINTLNGINYIEEVYNNELRTLLITYTCEVAKIDDEVFMIADREYSKADTILSNREKATLEIYNRLISEKYQAKTETPEPNDTIKEFQSCFNDTCELFNAVNSLNKEAKPEPELRVGWEYQNGRGEWVEIISIDSHPIYPFNSKYGYCYTKNGMFNNSEKTPSALILSTGRPVQKQPSTNWWESLKEGDLVVYGDNLLQVKNWYQEQLGEKRVWIEAGGYGRIQGHYKPYTPTPTEAIADLKNGKITEEQFQKVYKG